MERSEWNTCRYWGSCAQHNITNWGLTVDQAGKLQPTIQAAMLLAALASFDLQCVCVAG